MPLIEYQRIDLPIQVKRSKDQREIILTVGARAGSFAADRFASDLMDNPRMLLVMLGEIGFREELALWRARCAEASSSSSKANVISRVTLDIEDGSFVALPWEPLLLGILLGDATVVRVSPVRPRAMNIPFTFPWRFLQIDPRGLDLPRIVDQLLAKAEAGAGVAQAKAVPLEGLAELQRGKEWPTAEVLCFDDTRWPSDEEELLSTADPEKQGTLGWLARLTERLQTRLVVLSPRTDRPFDEEHRRLLSLAHALVARGGPAVLVSFRIYNVGESDLSIYEHILHDRPLDELRMLRWPYPWESSLFVGAGREEMLRASPIAAQIARPEVQSTLSTEAVRRSRASSVVSFDASNQRSLTSRDVRGALNDFLKNTEALDMRNLEGVVSFKRALRDTRKAILLGTEPVGVDSVSARRSSGDETRHTSCSLWDQKEDAALAPMKNTSLRVGSTYQLRVQIAPGHEDEWSNVIGSTALFEEVFKWSENKDDVWLEVAVTGLDFDVLGDAVQELRLASTGATEPLHFAVRPRKPGAGRLRVCVYYRNAILQSIRVAALVVSEGADDEQPEIQKQSLAAALDVPVETIMDIGVTTRMEYGGMPALNEIVAISPRALSIVANESLGDSVFCVKTKGEFRVVVDNSVPAYVTNVRDELERAMTNPSPTDPNDGTYAFGYRDDPNAGRDETLKNALNRFASVGRQVFHAIFANEGKTRSRGTIRAALAGGGETIQVAHVLLDKVIPWALLYDGDCKALEKNRTVCLAPLEGGRATQCGEHPRCVRRTEGVRESSVVCPLHFWGFRHRIELPFMPATKQANGDGVESGTSRSEEVSCTRPAQVLVALNRSLLRASDHEKEIQNLAADPKAAVRLRATVATRDAVLDGLNDQALDVLYFYCHAAKTDARGRFAPNLIFGAPDEYVDHTDLGDGPSWEHRPLVFLNACRTGAFSPDALSPFLIALVRDRGAAGVVMTEVAVWEQFSTEFAEIFLKSFFRGVPAADALLEARWALLRRNNPLGLVYTLYASADLRLRGP